MCCTRSVVSKTHAHRPFLVFSSASKSMPLAVFVIADSTARETHRRRALLRSAPRYLRQDPELHKAQTASTDKSNTSRDAKSADRAARDRCSPASHKLQLRAKLLSDRSGRCRARPCPAPTLNFTGIHSEYSPTFSVKFSPSTSICALLRRWAEPRNSRAILCPNPADLPARECNCAEAVPSRSHRNAHAALAKLVAAHARGAEAERSLAAFQIGHAHAGEQHAVEISPEET